MGLTSSSRTDDLAGVRHRVLAYLLDLVLVGGGVVAAARRLGGSRRERAALTGVLGLVVANLYHVVLEGVFGRTAGKRAVGIAVEMDDGRRCTVRSAAIRTAGRFVDWLPVGYLLGFVSIAVTERRKRLGDVVGNTVVVREDEGEANGERTPD